MSEEQETIMNTSKTINLPMDVAREIAKYNDQTQEIEKLTAELAKEKTTIEKLKVENEKAKIYKEVVFTMRDTFFDIFPCSSAGAGICDVCGYIAKPDYLTDCDACGCGEGVANDGTTLCVCENCRPDCMTFDEELGEYFCYDCMNKEAACTGLKYIPRIDSIHTKRDIN